MPAVTGFPVLALYAWTVRRIAACKSTSNTASARAWPSFANDSSTIVDNLFAVFAARINWLARLRLKPQRSTQYTSKLGYTPSYRRSSLIVASASPTAWNVARPVSITRSRLVRRTSSLIGQCLHFNRGTLDSRPIAVDGSHAINQPDG